MYVVKYGLKRISRGKFFMVVSSNLCIILGARSWGYHNTLIVIHSKVERDEASFESNKGS